MIHLLPNDPFEAISDETFSAVRRLPTFEVSGTKNPVTWKI